MTLARREGLAGAGGAEQRLARPAVAEALDELGDGLGLIAGGLELAGQLKLGGHVRPWLWERDTFVQAPVLIVGPDDGEMRAV